MDKKNQKSDSDKKLIALVAQKNKEAFTELFNRYQAKAYSTALRILREKELAEDAVQDAFLSIWLHANQFNNKAAVSSWIYRIVANQALMSLRKQAVKGGKKCLSVCQSEEVERGYLNAADMSKDIRITDDSIHYQQLLATIPRFPKSYFEVLYFTAIGFNSKELEAVLGISRPSIKSRLFRARELLAKKAKLSFVHRESEKIAA